MQFDTVLPEHFTTTSRTPWPHILIDTALRQLAGGGTEGDVFRWSALTAAGWSRGAKTPFASYPTEAAAAYNRLRGVLAQTLDPVTIVDLLQAG